jgi:hypothetical protein
MGYHPICERTKQTTATQCETPASLAFVHPARIKRDQVAYYFERRLTDELPDEANPAAVEVVCWKAKWREKASLLSYRWSPGLLHIEDRRNSATPKSYRFHASLREGARHVRS